MFVLLTNEPSKIGTQQKLEEYVMTTSFSDSHLLSFLSPWDIFGGFLNVNISVKQYFFQKNDDFKWT